MKDMKCDNKTIKAFENATMTRAKVYAYLYEELLKEAGEKKADKIFINAIYRLGLDKAKTFSAGAKKSALALAMDFVKDSIGNAVFKQKILTGDKSNAKVEMKNCPLVKMWKQMGLSSKRILKLCDLAYQVDFGTVEGLGYKLNFTSRIADNKKSCILEISKSQ